MGLSQEEKDFMKTMQEIDAMGEALLDFTQMTGLMTWLERNNPYSTLGLK